MYLYVWLNPDLLYEIVALSIFLVSYFHTPPTLPGFFWVGGVAKRAGTQRVYIKSFRSTIGFVGLSRDQKADGVVVCSATGWGKNL